MKTINVTENEYKALKLHWAGGHSPSKIAEKCNLTMPEYHKLIEIAQTKDVVIVCR